MFVGQTNWFRLVIFKDGKRIEKKVRRQHLPQLVEVHKKLQAQGIKSHIIGMTENRLYPPVRSVEANRAEDRLWCPYCGAWRYFNIPKAYHKPEIMTREWFMNVYRNSETRCCAWCDMPVKDYYIAIVNGIYHEVWEGSRRRRRKPGTRKRMTRKRAG